MIIVGSVLLLIGFLAGIPTLSTLGLIIPVFGLLLGGSRRKVGGSVQSF
jgi:hypothetical protein